MNGFIMLRFFAAALVISVGISPAILFAQDLQEKNWTIVFSEPVAESWSRSGETYQATSGLSAQSVSQQELNPQNPLSDEYIRTPEQKSSFQELKQGISQQFESHQVLNKARLLAPLSAVFSGAIVSATKDEINTIAQLGFVEAVYEDTEVKLNQELGHTCCDNDAFKHYRDIAANAMFWGIDRIDQRQKEPNGNPASGLSGSAHFEGNGTQASGGGVPIYIVDSGVSVHLLPGNQIGYHNELEGQVTSLMWVDALGDGYDCSGHGTFVHSVAAGLRMGVSRGSPLISMRAFGCNLTTPSSYVILMLDEIASNFSPPGVVNASFEARGAIPDSMIALADMGFVVVHAAGNDNSNECSNPAYTHPGIITVGSSNDSDQRATNSNYGACVDIHAPGHNVAGANAFNIDGYVSGTGTSFAAPMVAGVAANMMATHIANVGTGNPPLYDPPPISNTTPQQVKLGIINNATVGVLDGGSLNGSPNRLLYANWENQSEACDSPVLEGSFAYSITAEDCPDPNQAAPYPHEEFVIAGYQGDSLEIDLTDDVVPGGIGFGGSIPADLSELVRIYDDSGTQIAVFDESDSVTFSNDGVHTVSITGRLPRGHGQGFLDVVSSKTDPIGTMDLEIFPHNANVCPSDTLDISARISLSGSRDAFLFPVSASQNGGNFANSLVPDFRPEPQVFYPTACKLEGNGSQPKNKTCYVEELSAGSFVDVTFRYTGERFGSLPSGAQQHDLKFTIPYRSSQGGSTQSVQATTTIYVLKSSDAQCQGGPQNFVVGGDVSGLAGSGLVLRNNGSDPLPIGANGVFAFPTPIPDGSSYNVTVDTQPSSPNQSCSVSNGSGTISGSNITNINVACGTSNFTVGGTVTGLSGSGLELRNNDGDNLPISSNGSFTFSSALGNGSPYNVTVFSQPGSPSQSCSVSNGNGNISGGNVTNVNVNCSTSAFTVGGNVSGLTGSGLMLRNNGGDDLLISGNGGFTFGSAVVDGGSYGVTIQSSPSSPSQSCVVSNGGGTINGANVTNVSVVCSTTSYTVGGNVTGLDGTGLVLRNNGGNNLSISSNGAFTFSVPVADGQAYNVSVLSDPTGKSQTCSVSNGSGNISGADITVVSVNCTTNSYSIGGTVTGLLGTGMRLKNNGGNRLDINGNGIFTFTQEILDGESYVVTLDRQPSSPDQMCTVSNEAGNVNGANVTSVIVNCSTESYTIGGAVSGLSGSGLRLKNNGSDNLNISSNGSFTFTAPIEDGSPYNVTVDIQPNSPDQTCTVSNGNGNVDGADVTNVAVNCVTDNYTIGGTVSGLSGSGLQLKNNGSDSLSIGSNGSFEFTTPVEDGNSYNVTVDIQPNSPDQTCTVNTGSGNVSGADITNVVVNCVTDTYTIGGTASGVSGTGLRLKNNGVHFADIGSDGPFTFTTPIADGNAYNVLVDVQPVNPNQTCTVSNGSGTVVGADVSNVVVNCTNSTYSVGGTVVGLSGSGLVLQNNDSDNLSIGSNGGFTFTTPIPDGDGFNVSVLTQPSSPNQECSVSSGAGSVSGNDVTNVIVNCSTDTYTIGGNTTGLVGTGLVLQNTGGENLPVSANGSFTFSNPLSDGNPYSVSVFTQPSDPTQTCVVSNGSGNVSGDDVTNIAISCTTQSYSISGNVSGLLGSGMVLENNGGDNLPISSNGFFTFTTPVEDGNPYNVVVSTQPGTPSQDCIVSNGSGTIDGGNINSIVVNCATDSFTVGGTVTGLEGSGLVLRNNNGNNLTITSNGSFAFSNPMSDGSSYSVSIFIQPNELSQTCSASNASGTVNSENVTTVVINCVTDQFTVGGFISGQSGAGLQLQNNGGDNIVIDGGGLFTFPTPQDDGSAYAVSILTQPSDPNQTCVVSLGSGNVNGANVMNVDVDCVTEQYTVGGTVSGLIGSGMVLRNNLSETLNIDSNGNFTFLTPITDGNSYNVSVFSQPTDPNQDCSVSNDVGNVSGGNVTEILVTCSTDTYNLSGNTTGYAGSGLVLQNNGGDNLNISSNGSFTFSTPLADGSPYNVSVLTQPDSPSQTCVASSESGTINGADISSVAVTCTTNTYSIGGTVTGMLGSSMLLRNNGGNTLFVNENGEFAFTNHQIDDTSYNVTILSQPTEPSQVCTISNNTGTVNDEDVTSVLITCPTEERSIGGNVSGLTGSGLVLQNNGADNLPISASGAFTFAVPVDDGSPYEVTVLTQPSTPNQNCIVSNGSGIASGSDVSNVTVVCSTDDYSIGGNVTGLEGSGLVLQNNGGDNLAVSSNGTFTFGTPVSDGNPYNVSVLTQPGTPSQACNVSNGNGDVSGNNVTTVAISCVTETYIVGGIVTGLAGNGLVLQNNGGDDLVIDSDGNFSFPTPLPDDHPYNVTVSSQPNGPSQVCDVAGGGAGNGGGQVAGTNVTDVTIVCDTNTFTVGGTVMGMTGNNLKLENNGGNRTDIDDNGDFTFSTPLEDGSSYLVTIQKQPGSPSQTCTLGNASGELDGENVVNVTVTCADDVYTVGGTVTGLTGSGLVIQNNGGDELAINSEGDFTFSSAIADGSPFNVTVSAQPDEPSQLCTVTGGSGMLDGEDVTDVLIECEENAFLVGGTVSGMVGAGLILQNNGVDDLEITEDGEFQFTTPLADGNNCNVTVKSQPGWPSQSCTVLNGTGTVNGTDVLNVMVNCAVNGNSMFSGDFEDE